LLDDSISCCLIWKPLEHEEKKLEEFNIYQFQCLLSLHIVFSPFNDILCDSTSVQNRAYSAGIGREKCLDIIRGSVDEIADGVYQMIGRLKISDQVDKQRQKLGFIELVLLLLLAVIKDDVDEFEAGLNNIRITTIKNPNKNIEMLLLIDPFDDHGIAS